MNRMILQQCVGWLLKPESLVLLVLLGVALISSVGVVWSVHLTREQYSELQELQAAQDFLDVEYEKLLLEQGAWSDYARIDSVSRNELKMKPPSLAELVVVRHR
ncbi:MAG: cell division protein FtsL [Pseudomonadales bacterium]|nr:cell division protein FtsL [Pseudomonadales bacterium]